MHMASGSTVWPCVIIMIMEAVLSVILVRRAHLKPKDCWQIKGVCWLILFSSKCL